MIAKPWAKVMYPTIDDNNIPITHNQLNPTQKWAISS